MSTCVCARVCFKYLTKCGSLNGTGQGVAFSSVLCLILVSNFALVSSPGKRFFKKKNYLGVLQVILQLLKDGADFKQVV